jgi:hypothetical protein
MNSDDEIFLSAYLDGELTSEQRQRVESAMISDPRLLDDLHALAAVREMVATLPRTGLDRDLSVIVSSAIERRSRVFPFPGLRRLTSGRGFQAGVAIAAAACVILALSIKPGAPPAPGPVEVPSGPLHAQRSSIGSQAEVAPFKDPFAIDPIPGDESALVVADTAEPDAMEPASAAIGPAERRQEANQRQIRDLLDRADPTRVLVVHHAPGADAPARVGKLLESSALRTAQFARIRISQGIAIDPRNPGAATVFAVVMDESEFRDIRASLRDEFQDSLVETESEARPEIVTQLADQSDVSVVQGRAVVGLRVPDGPSRAIRTDDQPGVVKKSLIDPDGSVHRQQDVDAHPDRPPVVAETPNKRSTTDVEDGPNPRPSRRDRGLVASSPPSTDSTQKSIEVDRTHGEYLVLIWVVASPVGPSKL